MTRLFFEEELSLRAGSLEARFFIYFTSYADSFDCIYFSLSFHRHFEVDPSKLVYLLVSFDQPGPVAVKFMSTAKECTLRKKSTSVSG